MLKILRVISTMNPNAGGPCQGIRNSIPALKKLGVVNEVLCFDAPNSYFLKEDDFKIYAIGPAKGPYAYCRSLSSWLQENMNNYDCIIIHGLWLYNNYGTYRIWKKMKMDKKTNVKLFVMPHGMLDPYFQKSKERRIKALRNEIIWRISEKNAINNATAILFTCEEELRLAKTTFRGYKPNLEINVGYGIEKPPALKNNTKSILLKFNSNLEAEPYWLFLSRIHQKKGVDILIDAYNRLSTEYQNLPKLIIAGPTDSIFAKEMILKAQDNPKIYFPGMLKSDTKWEAFYGCEAFILPSHQENFGIAVVEALACSKPVLISNQINIYREIENSGAGIIGNDTENGTYEMMKKWIELSPQLKEKMSVDALKLFENLFTIEKSANTLFQSLKSAI